MRSLKFQQGTRGILNRLLCVLLLSLCFGARAQFFIDWHNVAGGGGTSRNAQYALTGTIGQPDAATPMTNEQFSVMGGFWVVPEATQSEGSPMLSIMSAVAGYVTISWTPNTTSYNLQEASSLALADWTNSPSRSTNPVTLPTSATAKFFRLVKQQ